VEVYTSRYLNYALLSSGLIVPVRISMIDPRRLLGELPYPLKYSLKALQPEHSHLGEWPKSCSAMWEKLSTIGNENITNQLASIYRAEGGKHLALCCYEDVTHSRGHQCHRVVLSVWWFERTGRELEEITDEGELLGLRKLHKQAAPVLSEGAL
jgi:hypothetical protein